MEVFLKLVSGVCWTIVYIESIRIGFREKTYAMPIFALVLNIAWEGLYTYLDFASGSLSVQFWINAIWFIFDLLIFYTFIRFGRKEITKYVKDKYFIPMSIALLMMAVLIQYSFNVEFKELGSWYSAFIQNLIMSILYINMLVQRDSLKGQNMKIAIAKWIGTLAPTYVFGVIYGNQLILVLGLLCSVFDILYVFKISFYMKKLKMNNKSSQIVEHI